MFAPSICTFDGDDARFWFALFFDFHLCLIAFECVVVLMYVLRFTKFMFYEVAKPLSYFVFFF